MTYTSRHGRPGGTWSRVVGGGGAGGEDTYRRISEWMKRETMGEGERKRERGKRERGDREEKGEDSKRKEIRKECESDRFGYFENINIHNFVGHGSSLLDLIIKQ